MYGKAPTNGVEVLAEFEKESVSELYAFSSLQDHGTFFNDVIITNNFENVIFSSSKSIDLILQNTTEAQRFFVVDGTFRITPNGIWQQVLILHVNFGIKVCGFQVYISELFAKSRIYNFIIIHNFSHFHWHILLCLEEPLKRMKVHLTTFMNI